MKTRMILALLALLAVVTTAIPAQAVTAAPRGEVYKGQVKFDFDGRCLLWTRLKNGGSVNVGRCDGDAGEQWIVVMQPDPKLPWTYATISPAAAAGTGLYLSTSVRGGRNALLENVQVILVLFPKERGTKIQIGANLCLSATGVMSFSIPSWQACSKRKYYNVWTLPTHLIHTS